MPKLSRKALQSPAAVFALYVAAGCLAVMLFRAVFPGEEAPLPVLERGWRRIRGVIGMIELFPALALSALALPFGMGAIAEEGRRARFSSDLFRRFFTVPVVAAISAAALYALLFFAALPLAQGSERNMRFYGELYQMALERAEEHIAAGEWTMASQFIGIADSVWSGSPALEAAREEVGIQLERARFLREGRPAAGAAGRPHAGLEALPGRWEPMTLFEAMGRAEEALGEGRLFDAHWMATLARRLAVPGGPEEAGAAHLAARAWNQIEAQRPTAAEARAHEMFALKMEGYTAMQAGDYVAAFYIFLEHSRLAPRDPDVESFLAISEQRLRSSAFFADEMHVALGSTQTGPIFSLPAEHGAWRGRAVLRLASLSSARNAAFGVGLEYMLFDRDYRLVLHLAAPYAKFQPLALGGPDAREQVTVMMRALDRDDRETRWEPEVKYARGGERFPPDAQIILNVSYETFLTLARMRHGISGMHVAELFEAAALSEQMGYIPQVFHAEILNRLGAGLFLLPAAIAAIAAAWNFRARRFPRILFAPLLFALPAAFSGASQLIQAGLNVIGISLALAFSFPAALALFSGILALAFVAALFILAAQRSGRDG